MWFVTQYSFDENTYFMKLFLFVENIHIQCDFNFLIIMDYSDGQIFFYRLAVIGDAGAV